MCLAVSNDTVSWRKPSVGLVKFGNSTDNNILLGVGGYIEPGMVFIDRKPGVPAAEKYKMVASYHGGATMFASADGVAFRPLTDKPSLTGSDTQDVVFWDARYNSYAYYGRTHERPQAGQPCPAGTQPASRSIGRMLIGTNVTDWPIHSANDVTTIFNVDRDDPPCFDVYTNGATPYAGIYLMFPLMFLHFPGPVNDGLLEPRLLASRDGVNFSYVGGNGRDAFVPRGPGVQRHGHVGIFKGAFDAAATAMARGIFEVGNKLVMLAYGSQYTHGGYQGWLTPGGPVLSGLQRLELRKDGFGSLAAANSTTTAAARTVPLRLPACPAGVALQLLINAQGSISGHFAVSLIHPGNGSEVAGFARADAVPMVGNFIDQPAAWGHPTPPAPAKPRTTCTYELPGGLVCSDGYIPMTCAEAKRLDPVKGCAAHGCKNKPTSCVTPSAGPPVCRGAGNGTELCVLSVLPPPAPTPPATLHTDLRQFGGAELQLQLELRDADLYSFQFSCGNQSKGTDVAGRAGRMSSAHTTVSL